MFSMLLIGSFLKHNAILATSKINEVNSVFIIRKCFSFLPHSALKLERLCSKNSAFTLDLLSPISFLTQFGRSIDYF